MDIAIVRTSSRCAASLLLPSEGHVHSVYRSAVNLLSGGGQMLALQPQGSPLSPISILLARTAFQALPVSEGAPFRISKGALTLNPGTPDNLRLYLASPGTELFDTALVPPEAPDHAFLRGQARALLASAPPGSLGRLVSEDGSGDFLLSAVRERLAEASGQCRQRHWPEAAGALLALTGLGIGLTPSGDDFLCGLLAGLLASGAWEHPLRRALAERISLSRTTRLSAAFLECALQGQFSEAVIRFFRLTPFSSVPERLALGGAFRAIGHTSGFDTLFGILYALSLTDPASS